MNYQSETSGRVRAALSGWTIERCAAFVALMGLLATIFPGFHLREWQGSASDFKTLYASAWCFAHGLNGYLFKEISGVFAANRVIPPHSWYAHAPVYPPFTLALMAICTLLPMVPAAYVWISLSAAVMACALAALARVAGDTFGLSRGWRMLMIAIFAASPLLSFGLEMGNVSVIVAALCILAITAPAGANPWYRATALAFALLLKPHVTVWVLLALFLLPERRSRAIAWRTIPLTTVLLSGIAIWMIASHQLGMQTAGYRSILQAELNGGSMASFSREIIAIPAQITALGSLLGYGFPRAFIPGAEGVILISFAAFLGWATLRVRDSSERFLVIAAWCAFGMLATYHRAHDGTILLLLLPWILARLRASWHDIVAWAAIAFLAASSIGPDPDSLQRLASIPHWHALAEFILYRQAPLAALLLALLLVGVAVDNTLSRRRIENRLGSLPVVVP